MNAISAEQSRYMYNNTPSPTLNICIEGRPLARIARFSVADVSILCTVTGTEGSTTDPGHSARHLYDDEDRNQRPTHCEAIVVSSESDAYMSRRGYASVDGSCSMR